MGVAGAEAPGPKLVERLVFWTHSFVPALASFRRRARPLTAYPVSLSAHLLARVCVPYLSGCSGAASKLLLARLRHLPAAQRAAPAICVPTRPPLPWRPLAAPPPSSLPLPSPPLPPLFLLPACLPACLDCLPACLASASAGGSCTASAAASDDVITVCPPSSTLRSANLLR